MHTVNNTSVQSAVLHSCCGARLLQGFAPAAEALCSVVQLPLGRNVLPAVDHLYQQLTTLLRIVDSC